MTDKEAMATGSVRDLLKVDIVLKEELATMFENQSAKQSATLWLVALCTSLVIVLCMFYMTRPNPIDRMVYEAIQKQRDSLRVERDALRIEKDSLIKYKK